MVETAVIAAIIGFCDLLLLRLAQAVVYGRFDAFRHVDPFSRVIPQGEAATATARPIHADPAPVYVILIRLHNG